MVEKATLFLLTFVSIATAMVESSVTERTVAIGGATVKHFEAMPTRLFIEFVITITKNFIYTN